MASVTLSALRWFAQCFGYCSHSDPVLERVKGEPHYVCPACRRDLGPVIRRTPAERVQNALSQRTAADRLSAAPAVVSKRQKRHRASNVVPIQSGGRRVGK